MIRVAMLSFWHVHARDYAREVTEHPDTQIVAVWDELPERGRKEAQERGVTFYSDLAELLAQSGIDAVVVDTPTNMHRQVMVAAAQAGKHIFTEKVIAATLTEVDDILKAVDENGVKLTVSLPRLNFDYTLEIQDILDQGLLGRLTLVRTRLSHNGATKGWLPEYFYNKEQCGGGAMIDLGCHPMYLTRLFLGMPQSVSATYAYLTNKDVEDNAVSVLRYDNGAVGIVEAGFVNSFSPFTIEVHGTDGSVLYSERDNQLLIRSAKLDEYAKGWIVRSRPHANETAFKQWVGHIQNGTSATENVGIAVDLTKLMEASNRSAAAGGAPVAIPGVQA